MAVDVSGSGILWPDEERPLESGAAAIITRLPRHPILTPIPLPTTHWPRVLALWLCGIFAAMQFSKVSFTFQHLQVWYGVAPAKMGLALSTVGMVGLVFGVTVGLFAHAIGYRRLLLLGLGLGAAMSFVQSLLPSYGLFFLSRVLEGGSQLAVVVAAPTLMVASCAPRHRSIAMGLWSTFVGVAFAVTAAVGGVIVAHRWVDGLLRLHACAMAAMLLVMWFVLPADPGPSGPRSWPRFSALPGLHRQIYSNLATALPGLCFFCYTIMAVALLTFLPLSAGKDRIWLAVVLPLLVTSGSFSSGWLAQYWLSPLPLARLAFGAVGLLGLAVGLSAGMGLPIAPAAMVLMFVAGLAGGAGYALIPYLSNDSLLQARANGAIAQMGNLGSTLGPPMFAALMVPLGLAGLVLPVVGFALLGVGLATWGARARIKAPSRSRS